MHYPLCYTLFILLMEFPSSPTLFAFLLFSFMLFKIVRRSKANDSRPKLPPGPWKLPLIGNMHNLVGALPHRLLRDMAKKYGPLMHLQLGEVSTLVVSSPEIAKEFMKTNDISFAQRPNLLVTSIVSYGSTNIGFAPYGEYWRQVRKICVTELLSAKRVKSFQLIREEEVSNVIKRIASHSGSTINLSEEISSVTFAIIARAAFGKKCKDQDSFIGAVTEMAELATGFCAADVFPSVKWVDQITGIRRKLEKLHQRIDRILQNIVKEHKERMATERGKLEGEEDLVDTFLKIQEDGDLEFPLTDNNVKAVILDMFSGGGETSSTVGEWAMTELIRHPRVMEKAQAEVRRVFAGKGTVEESGIHELKFMKAVVKETLRLHPPAPLLLPRECREGCEINGYEIPVKTRVIVNAWAIGRDPDSWTEPETFNPERFLDSSLDYKGTDFEFIPFGAGRRMCPGLSFAIPNVELPLANFLYHFDWKLPSGMKPEDLDMTEIISLSVRRKQDLHLIPLPYNPRPAE